MADGIIVIGTGAVGSWIGGSLAEQGLAVGFVGRSGPVRHAFRLEGGVGATAASAASRAHDVQAPSRAELRSARVAFIAVKAFQLEGAFAHTELLGDGCVVIPVVNGAVWDLVCAARNSASGRRLIWRLGYSTVGVSVAPPLYSVRAKSGHVDFGPLPGEPARATPAESALIQAWPVLAWHAQIAMLQRRKWLYNTVINSLCAAHGLARNGPLLADLPMLVGVFDEARRYAEMRWGAFSQGRDELYKGLVQLIEATEANENSMARDKRLGLRTESAYLAGLAANERDYPLLTRLHRMIES